MGKQSKIKKQRKLNLLLNKEKTIKTNADFDLESEKIADAERTAHMNDLAKLIGKGIVLTTEVLKEQGFDSKLPINQNEVLNAVRTNFFSELYGLNEIVKTTPGTFNFTRKNIFNAVCWLLILNPNTELCEKGNSLIKEAALEMYKVDGDRGMSDPLIWSFFPKSWHRIIDNAFHGVGEWGS